MLINFVTDLNHCSGCLSRNPPPTSPVKHLPDPMESTDGSCILWFLGKQLSNSHFLVCTSQSVATKMAVRSVGSFHGLSEKLSLARCLAVKSHFKAVPHFPKFLYNRLLLYTWWLKSDFLHIVVKLLLVSGKYISRSHMYKPKRCYQNGPRIHRIVPWFGNQARFLKGVWHPHRFLRVHPFFQFPVQSICSCVNHK